MVLDDERRDAVPRGQRGDEPARHVDVAQVDDQRRPPPRQEALGGRRERGERREVRAGPEREAFAEKGGEARREAEILEHTAALQRGVIRRKGPQQASRATQRRRIVEQAVAYDAGLPCGPRRRHRRRDVRHVAVVRPTEFFVQLELVAAELSPKDDGARPRHAALEAARRQAAIGFPPRREEHRGPEPPPHRQPHAPAEPRAPAPAERLVRDAARRQRRRQERRPRRAVVEKYHPRGPVAREYMFQHGAQPQPRLEEAEEVGLRSGAHRYAVPLQEGPAAGDVPALRHIGRQPVTLVRDAVVEAFFAQRHVGLVAQVLPPAEGNLRRTGKLSSRPRQRGVAPHQRYLARADNFSLTSDHIFVTKPVSRST